MKAMIQGVPKATMAASTATVKTAARVIFRTWNMKAIRRI